MTNKFFTKRAYYWGRAYNKVPIYGIYSQCAIFFLHTSWAINLMARKTEFKLYTFWKSFKLWKLILDWCPHFSIFWGLTTKFLCISQQSEFVICFSAWLEVRERQNLEKIFCGSGPATENSKPRFSIIIVFFN